MSRHDYTGAAIEGNFKLSGTFLSPITTENRIFCNLGHLVVWREVWSALKKRVSRAMLTSTNGTAQKGPFIPYDCVQPEVKRGTMRRHFLENDTAISRERSPQCFAGACSQQRRACVAPTLQMPHDLTSWLSDTGRQ